MREADSTSVEEGGLRCCMADIDISACEGTCQRKSFSRELDTQFFGIPALLAEG